jgi:hypothetical protein
MANAHYNPFKEQLLTNATALDLDGDVIKATLIDSADYTFSAAHDEYSGGSTDVAAAAKVAESAALTSVTCTNGTFDTADFAWAAVSGDQCEAVILWDDSITNDRLMTFYDTGMTGMPVTPSGGNINFVVHGSGWFAL